MYATNEENNGKDSKESYYDDDGEDKELEEKQEVESQEKETTNQVF